MTGIVEQLDSALAELLSGWNVYTTALSVGILGFIGWVVYDTQDADTHPLILARQAQASYVRQPGESAIFRSPETPHGCTCPLSLDMHTSICCALETNQAQTLSAPASL